MNTSRKRRRRDADIRAAAAAHSSTSNRRKFAALAENVTTENTTKHRLSRIPAEFLPKISRPKNSAKHYFSNVFQNI